MTKNLLGQKFGRLTVTRQRESNIRRKSCWECACECGNVVVAIGAKLRGGRTKSCGCLARDNARAIADAAKTAAGGLDYKARGRAKLMVWTKALREEAEAAKTRGEVSTISEFYYRRGVQTKYGCTPEQLDEMLVRQQGVCAICSTPPAPGKRLHLDHNHATGAIRGLLCNGCNTGLGHFGEDIMRMARAMKYLSDNSQ